jgi:hypothetical protein
MFEAWLVDEQCYFLYKSYQTHMRYIPHLYQFSNTLNDNHFAFK